MPKRIGSKERIRRFLRERVGQVVTAKQLQETANVSEWARRLREIRNDEGWLIFSHLDDSDLKPGEYRVVSIPSMLGDYDFSKPISARTRAQVLDRNGQTCQMCGAGAGEPDDQNPGRKVRLHIGHIVDRSHGGTDDLTNLRALCSTCNQGAQNLTPAPPSRIFLMTQIRRAKVEDQKEALRWLQKKFVR